MTGGSLGLRTGSYGSLQQQLQNNAFLPIHTTPFVVRKPSKMLLSSTREKERFLPRVCKVASRRGVGMLLVVVLSVFVFMSVLSAVNKDEETITDAESHSRSTLQVPNSRTNSSSMSSIDPDSKTSLISEDNDNNKIDVDQDKKNDNIPFLPNNIPMSGENKAQLSPILVGNAFPSVHPCDKFVLPSPPPDRKRTGPRPCPVCYLPVEQAIARMPIVPSPSPVLRNLTYVYEESLVQTELFGGSDFGGYPSLQQRNDSFDIKESMNVHCGFVNGSKPGRQTGFDIDDADLLEMEQCFGVVVASAIFGNYDIIQHPRNISEAAKTNVCFYLFVDEETEAYIRNSTGLDDRMKVGIWRVVVVRNLPYVDARRNGKYMDGPSAILSFFAKQTSSLFAAIKFVLMHDKCSELIPKLLLHRIFSNARYSIWIDGKLQLVVDPYQVLERFLWRKNASFAISRHYRRFDVFEEAEANKAAGKYDNTSINFQVEFYRREGLTPYSEAKLPITSDVPEGCVIIKEHIPITNLFTCLWFNEVDRFTSRDQISFSTVRDKIMSKVNWGVEMFLDCERRNFVVQGYHKDLLEHMNPPPILNDERIRKLPTRSSTAIIIDRLVVKAPIRKLPIRRGRDRKAGPRRHRKTYAGIRDSISI